MVCNPQCDQRWGRGIGGLLDGRAPQQATFHSQGMPRNIPHLNGCERPPPARHAPLGQPRRVWPLCCPAGVCARPAQSHRGRAGSGQGSPAPLHGRLPWASPLSSSLFPALTRLWGVRQLELGGMGWEKWARGQGGEKVRPLPRRGCPHPTGQGLAGPSAHTGCRHRPWLAFLLLGRGPHLPAHIPFSPLRKPFS